jgi:hypothetical protein
MLKKGIKDLLLAAPDVSALVGKRVHVDRVPDRTAMPSVIIKGVASEYSSGLKGTNRTQMRRLQVDCWATTPREADKLAEAVHDAMDSYKGVLSESTSVLSCLPSGGDVDLTDEELKLAGIAVDMNVWFTGTP